jgi:hypothetical protein
MLPGGLFNLSPEALNDLAMNYDPSVMLNVFSQMPQGNMLTMPQPAGVEAGEGPSFESIIGETPVEGPKAPRPPTAPLDPVALRTLAGMMPAKDPRHVAPAAGLRGPVQFNLPPVRQPLQKLSMSQILGR